MAETLAQIETWLTRGALLWLTGFIKTAVTACRYGPWLLELSGIAAFTAFFAQEENPAQPQAPQPKFTLR